MKKLLLLIGLVASSWLLTAQICLEGTCAGGPNSGLPCSDDMDCEGFTLPVRFKIFTGLPTQEGIELYWVTAAERNNRGFHVQTSTDAAEWQSVGFVPGGGTSETEREYTYTIPQQKLSPDSHYFRLRQVDLDGHYEYSPLLTVRRTRPGQTLVYPNPTRGKFTVLLDGMDATAWTFTLHNSTGQEVFREVIPPTQDATRWSPEPIADLRAGSYFFTLRDTAGRIVGGNTLFVN